MAVFQRLCFVKRPNSNKCVDSHQLVQLSTTCLMIVHDISLTSFSIPPTCGLVTFSIVCQLGFMNECILRNFIFDYQGPLQILKYVIVVTLFPTSNTKPSIRGYFDISL